MTPCQRLRPVRAIGQRTETVESRNHARRSHPEEGSVAGRKRSGPVDVSIAGLDEWAGDVRVGGGEGISMEHGASEVCLIDHGCPRSDSAPVEVSIRGLDRASARYASSCDRSVESVDHFECAGRTDLVQSPIAGRAARGRCTIKETVRGLHQTDRWIATIGVDECVQHGIHPGGRQLKDDAAAAAALVPRGAVQVPVGSEQKRRGRGVPIVAGGKRAETVNRADDARWRHLEYLSVPVGSGEVSRAVKVAVLSLDEGRVNGLVAVGVVEVDKGLEGLRGSRNCSGEYQHYGERGQRSCAEAGSLCVRLHLLSPERLLVVCARLLLGMQTYVGGDFRPKHCRGQWPPHGVWFAA